MPDISDLDSIAKNLEDKVPGLSVDASFCNGLAVLVIDPDKIKDVLSHLKDDPNYSYKFLSSIHAADYLPKKPRFGVHYELLSMERADRIRVKVPIDDPEESLPEVDSCTDLFPTANFQEREIYDMFGIKFRGHPDLRRILMPDDYGGHPQRRDFPMGGESVEFTFNEDDLKLS